MHAEKKKKSHSYVTSICDGEAESELKIASWRALSKSIPTRAQLGVAKLT